MTDAILDPTLAQIHAAACAWIELILSDADADLLRALLGAPTTYDALCAINGISADRGWEFSGGTYRAAEAARRAATEEAAR